MNETKALSTIDEIMASVFSETELDAMEQSAKLIAHAIRLRKRAMSQRRLSRITGVRQSNISRIENLKVNPSLNSFLTYLNAFGYSLSIIPVSRAKIIFETDVTVINSMSTYQTSFNQWVA